MKRLFPILLCAALLWGCAAPPAEASPTPAPTPAIAPTASPTAEPEPRATPAPTAVPELVFDEATLPEDIAPDYLAARGKNPEVCAYLIVPNTSISYPVALGKDNDYYLSHDLTGEDSKSGAIFFDYRTDELLNGSHLILYGHNMRAGTMFHDLNSYKHKEFFENTPIITLYAGSEKREYQVYAAYIAPPDVYFIRTQFEDAADFLSYIQQLQSLSKFPTDTELTADDQILTLATCTYETDDARFVVQAKRIS